MSVSLISSQIRPILGDFSSIICFKAVVVGIEEALGDKAALIALIAAGRARGKQLAEELNLQPGLSFSKLTEITQQALGKDGTRLCLVDKIEAANDIFRVSCRETICSSQEPQGSSRTLSYTMGALQGVLEVMTGKRLRGTQIESVLRGGTSDVVEFQVIESSY
jgi:hypothetical protein